MTTYYIAELQNLASIRKAEKITANDLAGAKRAASKNQTFQGTVLKVMDAEGYLLAVKENGQWRSAMSAAPEISVSE